MAGRIPRPVREGQGAGTFHRFLGSTAIAAVLVVTPILTQTYPVTASTAPSGTAVLTPDSTDAYTYEGAVGTINVGALSGNTAADLRTVFWPVSGLSGVPHDEQSCATFANETTWSAQEGVALRVRRAASGGVSGFTVTKNVWFGATWIFNVHWWDGTPTLHPAGSFNLGSVFRLPDGRPRPFPWTLCARVVGAQLTMKAWPSDSPEPAWGDERYGGTRSLSGYPDAPGVAGWYVAHLPRRASAQFTDLRTWAIDATGGTSDPATTLHAFGSVPNIAPGGSVTVRGSAVDPAPQSGSETSSVGASGPIA